MLVDKDAPKALALVIDSNPMSRSLMCQHLRDFGFGSVKAANRIADAREMLEHRQFDLVICDDQTQAGGESGQDLLDELRREQQLHYNCVFVMVTSEATYQKVAEAAEAALDSFLIKPFSANTLYTRIKEARQRKRLLRDIFEALEQREFDRAIALSVDRYTHGRPYGLYAARIGAELLLQQQRHAEALALFDSVASTQRLPWARLGIARVQLAQGDLSLARRSLSTLINDEPRFADAHDVLGKVHMEQGQISEAMATYQMAAEITPGCILRLQHAGTLTFYAGPAGRALATLERTWAMGAKSRLFDVLSMMLLGFLRFDAGDVRGVGQASEVMTRFAGRYPQSLRLRRMAQLGHMLTQLLGGAPELALAQARSLLDDVARPDFDIEAATNLLSLLTRLASHGMDSAELRAAVERLGRRFAVSKAATEVLAAALRQHEQAPDWVRHSHAQVMQLAEAAMQHAVRGEPQAAVASLLDHGSETGNAKLIEMAGLVARRHQDRISALPTLLERANTLAHRYCQPMSHIAGVRRSNRSPGGMVLRR